MQMTALHHTVENDVAAAAKMLLNHGASVRAQDKVCRGLYIWYMSVYICYIIYICIYMYICIYIYVYTMSMHIAHGTCEWLMTHLTGA